MQSSFNELFFSALGIFHIEALDLGVQILGLGFHQDLDGVVFCDLPLTLTTNSEFKRDFNTTWKDQRAYTRLFALGIDAYNIVQNLKYLQSHEYARFSGETGNISMDENQRLHRELLWAQFKNGKPVYLDLTILPVKAVADGKQS